MQTKQFDKFTGIHKFSLRFQAIILHRKQLPAYASILQEPVMTTSSHKSSPFLDPPMEDLDVCLMILIIEVHLPYWYLPTCREKQQNMTYSISHKPTT